MSKRLSESEALSPHPKRQLLSSDNVATEPEPAIRDDTDSAIFTKWQSFLRWPAKLNDQLTNGEAAYLLSNIMGFTDAFSRKFQNFREVEDVVSAHPELIISLRSAWEARSLKPLLASRKCC